MFFIIFRNDFKYVFRYLKIDSLIIIFLSQFTGWPKVTIMALPKEKFIICIVVVVLIYMITILVSCGVYLAILIQKKRKFNNRISAQNMSDSENLSRAIQMGPIMIQEDQNSNSSEFI